MNHYTLGPGPLDGSKKFRLKRKINKIMKNILKKIWSIVTYPWAWYQHRKAVKIRLAELKKRDPFIYK